MPGFVGHIIRLNRDYDNLYNIDINLPATFKDVEYSIREEMIDLKNEADRRCDTIIPMIAEDSKRLIQGQIHKHNCIITGRLLNSIEVLQSRDFARVGTDLEYASYVDEGRGYVYPVRAKCLHYFTKEGNEVFAMYSRPSKPKPFNTDSSNELDGVIDDKVGRLLDTL